MALSTILFHYFPPLPPPSLSLSLFPSRAVRAYLTAANPFALAYIRAR